MATDIFPENFYKDLYEEICSYAESNFECDDEEATSTSISMELEIGDILVCLNADFDVEWQDDSFDHAFGTWDGWHMELRDLQDIDIEAVYDEEGEDITKKFDNNAFWAQFHRTEVKLKSGEVIKAGDDVQYLFCWATWLEMTFEYYDTLHKRYVGKDAKGYQCTSRSIRKAA